MVNNLLYLQYLLCMDLNGSLTFDYSSNNCFALKCGSQIASTNRVCSQKNVSVTDINNVKGYFGHVPFIWFIENVDTATEKLLIQNGFSNKFNVSAMCINLKDVEAVQYNPKIKIRKIELDLDDLDSSLDTWLEIVSQSFGRDKKELAKHINYTVNRASKNLVDFYLGFYEQAPVSASLIVHHNDIITLHWVGTLSEYRGKGLGYAISHVPLIDAKNKGLSQALLLATNSGKALYEKIGFKEYASYRAYGN